jgi:hypothetical protein
MENELNVSHLRPKQMNVSLHDGSQITVPVFDAKSMIMDILTNDSCMQPQNIATGYDLFSGDVNNLHPDNQKYGEIHTGDCWLPARDIFCPKVKNEFNMPAALIIFGDKSHTDLHGALALTTCLNHCECRLEMGKTEMRLTNCIFGYLCLSVARVNVISHVVLCVTVS